MIKHSLKQYRNILIPILPTSFVCAALISLPTLFSQHYTKAMRANDATHAMTLHALIIQAITALGVMLISTIALSFMFLCVQHLLTNKILTLPADVLKSKAQTLLTKLPALCIGMFLYSSIVVGGILLFVLPGIIMGIMLALYVPAILFDHKKAWAAIKYSFSIVRKNIWPITGFLLLFFVLNSFISMLLRAAWIATFTHHHPSVMISWLLNVLVNGITTPWVYIGLLLLYAQSKEKYNAAIQKEARSFTV